MTPWIELKKTNSLFTIMLLLAFALMPLAKGVVPPPDGGYPGFNTAEGQNALLSLDTSTGVANTAVGWFSLTTDVNGSFNTGVGAGTLLLNVGDPTTGNGSENTAVGRAALLFNTTGSDNTANGAFALFSNTTGNNNTANGFQALFHNVGGISNNAIGAVSLFFNTSGSFNQAVGTGALLSNADGNRNIAIGDSAALNNGTGSFNTVIGDQAGQDLGSGTDNIYIGATAGNGAGDESRTIRIGDPQFISACFISGITGVGVSGDPVVVDRNGQLGTAAAGSPLSMKELLEQRKKVDEQQAIIAELKATLRSNR